jgi:PAS domain S-box-containing protein
MKKDKENYSTLFDFNPLPNWVYDRDTFEILDVNYAAIALYGYNKTEFSRLTIQDLTLSGEVSKMQHIASQTDANEGSIYFGIFTHKKKNGESIRVEINGHKIDFLEKKCILVVCLDVTEREFKYANLKESEKRLKAASAIAKLGYWKLELDANTLSWSDEVYKIWGRSKQNFDVNYESFFQSIHPDDKETFELEQNTSFAGLKEHDFEHRIILPNGSVRWVHELGRLVKDKNGKPVAFEGTVSDVTAQKEEVERLRLLESIITNTSDAVLITEAEPFDAPGPLIVYVNEAFTKMTGYTADEVIGKTPRILQGPKSDKAELAKLKKALQNWEPCEITTINYKKSGEEFWINFSVTPIANEKGRFTHWIAIERDVTKKKNRELEQNLLSQISLIFNEEEDLKAATNKLCSTFAAFGRFDFVEVWVPNLEKSHIQLFSYFDNSDAGIKFHLQTQEIKTFKFGEGITGLVWETKSSVFWDVGESEDFMVRKHAAVQTGIQSVSGIPLLFKDSIVGVLVFGSSKGCKQLKQHVGVFHDLETFIGSEMSRKSLESSLNHLFEAIPDIICLADFQGRFLKMNKAGCELLGYTEEELLFHYFDEFVHPRDKDISAQEVQKLGIGETTFKFENRYLTKKGEIVWLSWVCNSQVEEGVIYASAKNITKEKKLRELNIQAASLAKIGSWEIDLIENKLFWTDMVHKLHETDPKTFVPDLVEGIQFYRKDFREMIWQNINSCILEGKTFNFEAVLVTAKNNERWVRVIGDADLVDEKCTRVYGSFQDIHEIKEAESRLQSLADNLPGVVFQYVLNTDGSDTLKYVSKGSVTIWGFEPEEPMKNVNLIWDQIKEGGDLEEVQRTILESIKSTNKWTARWRYLMPSGELRTHIGYGTPEYLSDGTVIFNSLVLDITEEKKNEELLQQATSLARIGSWELDTFSHGADNMYWSTITKQILEVEESYNPSLTGGFEFYAEESKIIIQDVVEKLIKDGTEFDVELLLITATGKDCWVRCIGKSERIQGKCIKIFGSFQNIHAAKTTQLQLSEILGSISDAFYALDRDWNITYFNKEAENLLQKKCTDIVGKNLWQEFPATIGTQLEEIYHSVLQFQKVVSFEYLFPRDGKWYEINVYPSSGGISVYFKNIDERKKATEIIRKTSEEKTMILESIGDAFFTMDKNFIVTYWNKQAEELVFTKREAIVGRNLLDVFPTAVNLPSYKYYLHVLNTGEIAVFEDYFADKYLEVNAYPSENGITVFFRDISERKNAEKQILAANERFEKVTEATNDAIWDWNIEEDTLYWGSGFKKLFGYNVDKISPTLQSWIEHLHPDDIVSVYQSLLNVVDNAELQNWQSEYRYKRENGTYAFVVDRGIAIRNREGKAVRMVGAVTDISERKLQEVKLQEVNESLKKYAHELELSNEQLEQFAFIASHDLQEPLRMITSFMNQLERKYGSVLDKKAHEYIYFATDGAKRMKQIILDLLEYSRAGKFEEKKEIVNIVDLIEDYKTLRRKIIIEKSVVMNFYNLPLIEVFRVPLVQTLHCLLDNAIKYSFKNVAPIIELKIEDKTEEWLFVMKDNGIGIADQFFKKIFIIFQRLHNRDEYSGTGIGLAIAKKHIESWGGRIWLESEVGKGTIFYFTVPKKMKEEK